VTGMDLGYYKDTKWEQTQTFYELLDMLEGDRSQLEKYFHNFSNPTTGEGFYTDPTYYGYRRAFFDLLAISPGKTINCTEGGTLFGNDLECMKLDQFFQKFCTMEA